MGRELCHHLMKSRSPFCGRCWLRAVETVLYAAFGIPVLHRKGVSHIAPRSRSQADVVCSVLTDSVFCMCHDRWLSAFSLATVYFASEFRVAPHHRCQSFVFFEQLWRYFIIFYLKWVIVVSAANMG